MRDITEIDAVLASVRQIIGDAEPDTAIRETALVLGPDQRIPGTSAALPPADPIDDRIADVPPKGILTDLIVEIIHRELSGPLGERMMQNLDEIVRREVVCALDAVGPVQRSEP